LPEPSEHRLDQRPVVLPRGEVAQALNAHQALVDDQPIEHLVKKPRLTPADLEGQK
jgi:hypothetical protein